MQGLRACVLKACVGENCACLQAVRACKACVKVCVREGREGRVQGLRACKVSVQGLRACVLEVCVRARRVCKVFCVHARHACVQDVRACVQGVREGVRA